MRRLLAGFVFILALATPGAAAEGTPRPAGGDVATPHARVEGVAADAFVSFALDPDRRVEQAKMRAVSPASDYCFDFHDLPLEPVRRP